MAANDLFKRLCDPELMAVGWHLAHADSRDDFATDPLGYADYAFLKKERFRFIVEQLQHDRYRVGRLTEIDIPKTGLSVRPGNVIPIEEATILHAIIYLIAPKIDPKLKDGVYSYRLAKDWKERAKKAESLFTQSQAVDIPFLKRKTIRAISIEEPWYEAWPEFDAAGLRAFRKQHFTHLTKTDITAYFENIDLELLGSMLRRYLPKEITIVEILLRILNSWTRRTSTGIPIDRGIPQGSNISSFLGNIYLAPLDEALEQFVRSKSACWFRYVDDIKVFTKTYDDAREAVFLINKELRQLHLNLQGGKTEILDGEELKTELYNSDLNQVNTIIEKAQKLTGPGRARQITKLIRESQPVTQKFTRGLPASVASLKTHDSRVLRRCFTLYGSVQRPQLRKAALAALKQIPDLRILRSTLGYLVKLDYRYHDEIVTELLELIEAHELPFPYQVALTIETLSRTAPFDPRGLASRLRLVGYVGKKHWYVRQKTLEAIMHLPYRETAAEKLAGAALKHPNPWVRRAGAALVLRGRPSQVNEMIKTDLLYHADPDVARIGLFWQYQLTNLPVANREITNLLKADPRDVTFYRRLPTVYLMRCSSNEQVKRRLREYLDRFSKSKNTVVRWHCEQLLAQLPSTLRA